jgi:hypothetical protein
VSGFVRGKHTIALQPPVDWQAPIDCPSAVMGSLDIIGSIYLKMQKIKIDEIQRAEQIKVGAV